MPQEENLMSHRLGRLETDVSGMRGAITSIAESLQTLAALEAHHAETRDGLGRAFRDIEKHDARIRTIEASMPVLSLTSAGTQRIGWLILTSVILAILALVLR